MATPDAWRKDDYTEVAVAYLDMFGFSDYLSQEDTKVSDVLLRLEDLRRDDPNDPAPHSPSSPLRCGVFSDCMVLALPVTSEASVAVEKLLWVTIRVQRRLTATKWTRADQEFHPPVLPVRGGISVGQLYWDERHVFGEALVKAAHLESKVAGWPRVVVDSGLPLGRLEEWDYPESLGYYFRCGIEEFPLLLEDAGVKYLNYLAPIQKEMGEWNAQPYSNHLRDHKELILALRRKAETFEQRGRVLCWAEYHNSIVRMLKEDRHAASYFNKKELLVDI